MQCMLLNSALRPAGRRIIPAVGTGPSVKQMKETGYWKHDLVAYTEGPNPHMIRGPPGGETCCLLSHHTHCHCILPKVSAARSSDMTVGWILPRSYWAGSKGLSGSGTYHTSAVFGYGGRPVSQVIAVCSCIFRCFPW